MAINNPPPSDNVPAPGKRDDRVLEWSPKPKGTFSGIDYSQKGAAQGLDPYFVWADISGFAHLRKPGQAPADYVPQSLPMLVALQPKVTALDLSNQLKELNLEGNPKEPKAPALSISAAYLDEANLVPGGVVPATVNRAFFNARAEKLLPKLVRSIEIDLPQEANLNLKPLEKTYKPVKREKLKGKVIALIDDGCAFAHPHFLRKAAGAPLRATRVKRLWDMNVRGPLSTVGPPSNFVEPLNAGEYGRDFSDLELNQMIQARTYGGRIDEDAVYADFGRGTLDNVNRLQSRAAHGTHVMDMACGPYFVQDTMCTRNGGAEPENPTWTKAQSFPTEGHGQNASDAQIIFVQLPMRTVQDTSGRNTMTTDVIDAFTYIINQCADDTQIVVNLSWGALAGPHDGTHLLEQYMDALIAHERLTHMVPAGGNRLQITMPAGNGYQSRTHATFALHPGQQSPLVQWRIAPDDATESYVEIWLEQDMQVEVRISDPLGNTLVPPVRYGDVRNLAGYHVSLLPGNVLGAFYNDAGLAGQNGHCVLLAVAPTVSSDGTRVTAPHGVWQLTVTNIGETAGVVDAYIERDDVALGTRRGARQSYFEDINYDRQAKDDNKKVDLECPNPLAAYVRREGVFNNISTGGLTEKAGGVRETDSEIAEYSPHDFFSALPKRPGTATLVQYYATTEESPTLHGVRAAGTRAASTVRLSGTSTAAPQIARDLFNALP
jgi:hypothetical protein